MSSQRHILVIDDSAVVRFLMTELLTDAGFEVDTAPDPVIALRKIEERRPDVLLLDLEMPRMSGFDLLRELAPERIPAVILSSHTPRATSLAMRAFDLGAVEVMAKPPHGLEEFLRHSAPQLIQVLRTAAFPGASDGEDAAAPPIPTTPPHATAPLAPTLPPDSESDRDLPRLPTRDGSGDPFADRDPRQTGAPHPSRAVIAIGASTGGPQALERLLRHASPELPGMVVVQHMPPGFTQALAMRLDALTHLRVREARDGDPIRPGTVLIAPGDRHLQVTGEPRHLVARLWAGPAVNRHRPSVEVLFDSVLHSIGGRACALMLSGMGADGVDGLARLRDAGALTLAQSEETCVVYGMPREAVRSGAAAESLPPGAIAQRLETWSRSPRTHPPSVRHLDDTGTDWNRASP